MVVYECPRCHYETTLIPNFRKHLTRKNTCRALFENVPIETIREKYKFNEEKVPNFTCELCDKCYSSRSGFNYHKATCNAAKAKNNGDVMTSISEETKLLKEIVTELITHFPKTTNITNNINIQNNQNILVLNDFGKEDTTYLTPEFMENCLLNLNKGMTSLIKEIHFNPDYPQNHNIKLNSKKHALLEKRSDGKWVIVDKSGFLDDIVKRGHRLLHTYYISNDEFKHKVDNNYTGVLEWMNNVMHKMPNVIQPLKRDLFALILNNHMMLFEYK